MDKELEKMVAELENRAESLKELSMLKSELPKGKLFPKIPKQKEKLRTLCLEGLNKIASDDMEEAKERMEWELNAIAETEMEFQFLHVLDIFHKLDLRCCDISGRGPWMGSLVAYLIGISEVNPITYKLAPEFVYGFDGNKEIDIDINLPESMFNKRFDVCRTLEGVSAVAVPGTEGTWHEDEIETYIKEFEEKHHTEVSPEDKKEVMERLCGQFCCYLSHPGGVILVPEGEDIEKYAYMRENANGEMTTITDYHLLDNCFCKLDLLSHWVPEALLRLSKRTGVDVATIPIFDDKLYSFMIESINAGDLYDIYEYQNEFTQMLLKETGAKTFNQLVKVTSLSHGTGAWLDNADELIKSGTATIDNIIAAREDVFDYCISLGLDRKMSFMITETVRKGIFWRHPKHMEWRIAMLDAGAEEWFVDSCEKIRYLFPRAHAISYMFMVMRMVWFKMHYPEIYTEVVKELGQNSE